MSAKEQQQITESSVGDNNGQIENPLGKILNVHLLPESRFRTEEGGQVLDALIIDGKIGVLRKTGDSTTLEIYDHNGDLKRTNLDPSASRMGSQLNNEYLSLKPEYEGTQNVIDPFTIIKKLGYSDEYARKSAKVYYANHGFDPYSRGVREDSLKRSRKIFGVDGWKLQEIKVDGVSIFGVYNENTYIGADGVNDAGFIRKDEFGEINPDIKITGGDLTLTKEENRFRIVAKNGLIATYSGADVQIDPINPNILYFINTGKFYKLDTSLFNSDSLPPQPILESKYKIDKPEEFEMDPYGNFILARSGENLMVLDRETGDVLKSFENVGKKILINEEADIIIFDKNGKLRLLETNFQAIPRGVRAVDSKQKAQALRKLQERFAELDLEKVAGVKKTDVTEDDVKAVLKETISKQVSSQIGESSDPEVIQRVLDKLQVLKSDPANTGYESVIDEFIIQARDKLSVIKVADLDNQLTEFEKMLDGVKSVGDTIGLDEQFGAILDFRQKTDITDPKVRSEVERKLNEVMQKKDAVNIKYQGELIEAAKISLPAIRGLVGETGSLQELGYLAASNEVQKFEMILANIKDPQVRRQIREEFNQIKLEQKTKLEERSKLSQEQDRLRWAQIIEEAKADLGLLREQIEGFTDSSEVERFGANPLVVAWRAKLIGLPPELREIEEKKLEIILGGRKKDMEHRKDLGAIGESGELKFGDEAFPVYKEPPRIWKPKLTSVEGALSGWADLTFEDSEGRIWKPDQNHETIVSADPNDEMTKLMIERHKGKADEYFKGLKRKVPDFDEHWRITDYHMEKLEEVVQALNLQLNHHRGILLLQGEAGTGKNVLIDMLANLSNREVISVLCNENSVKEDLTYEFYYDPEKGTYRLPSKLIEGIQKPGSIILFDEINALKPGIAKMLNSLFDYRRRISPPGGTDQEIITHPTVLFVGTMNPQNYAGVNRLSPEVKSRSRVIDLDYPPFEEIRGGKTHFRSDEAEMLAAYSDDLSELKPGEFKKVWDYVANEDTSNGADLILTGNPKMQDSIEKIKDIIRVANGLRDIYESYQVGDSNEPMDFPTSLREVTDIVMEMNHRDGLKEVIKRVIIPKIDDRRQKRLVEQTIDSLLPEGSSSSGRRVNRRPMS